MSLGQWKTISEIFQAFAIGIGALLGGLGALKVLSEWVDVRSRRKKIKKWRKSFPKEKRGEDFKLAYASYPDVLGGGAIYIIDERMKVKHWVADEDTLKLLGFNLDEAVGVPVSEFKKIKDGETIALQD